MAPLRVVAATLALLGVASAARPVPIVDVGGNICGDTGLGVRASLLDAVQGSGIVSIPSESITAVSSFPSPHPPPPTRDSRLFSRRFRASQRLTACVHRAGMRYVYRSVYKRPEYPACGHLVPAHLA